MSSSRWAVLSSDRMPSDALRMAMDSPFRGSPANVPGLRAGTHGEGPGMRIVVTGATGNVGTSVVAALAADPRVTEIVGLARRRPRLQSPRTTWVEADVVS